MESKYKPAIDQLREDLRELAVDLQGNPAVSKMLEVLRLLNDMERFAGMEQTLLANVFFGDNGNGAPETAPQKLAVKFDEFIGLKPIEAAQSYLKKCRDARPFDEIVRAVNDGSGRTLSAEEERKLRRSLIRSTFRVVKIKDRFGHLNNYPKIAEERKRKGKPQPEEDPKEATQAEETPKEGE